MKCQESTDTFDKASERQGYGPPTIEAYCSACDETYILDEAEELDWQCDCGGHIKEN